MDCVLSFQKSFLRFNGLAGHAEEGETRVNPVHYLVAYESSEELHKRKFGNNRFDARWFIQIGQGWELAIFLSSFCVPELFCVLSLNLSEIHQVN